MNAHRGLEIAVAILFCIALGFASYTALADDVPASTRDCANCPEMVTVPAGAFEMGGAQAQAFDRTSRHVTFAKPFAIGRYEVTFDEWDACVADGGCKYQPSDQGWGRGKRPVTNVSWDNAQEYVAWLAKKTGQQYRLPTEAEWEYAARAGTTTEYFWGDNVGAGHANCAGCGSKWDDKQTAPVGSFPPNAFGLYDTAGNVEEWVEDCYLYPTEVEHAPLPADGSAATKPDCGLRILRGGSWHEPPFEMNVARPDYLSPWNSNALLGFRVAKTLP